MSRYERNYLLRMLWDMNQSQESITSVSRYIGSFPNKREEIVSVWEEQLYECYGERKILFLYVLNDVIQNYRSSPMYNLFVDKLNTFLYAVIRDVPSLVSKVKRLLSVWNDRKVIEESLFHTSIQTVDRAIDDYHHNVDHREKKIQTNQSDSDHHALSDEVDSSQSYDELHEAISVESPRYNSIEDEEPQEEEMNEEKYRFYEALIRGGATIEITQRAIHICQSKLNMLPPWVMSTTEFRTKLGVLLEDVNRTNDTLLRALEPAMDLENHLNSCVEKRERVIGLIDKVKEWKKRHVEEYDQAIDECEAIIDMIDDMKENEKGEIRGYIRRSRSNIATMDVTMSSKAMDTITHTLKRAEEEEDRKRAVEEDNKRKERAIRDSISKEMIRTSVEDMVGKTWNAKGLFDRIV